MKPLLAALLTLWIGASLGRCEESEPDLRAKFLREYKLVPQPNPERVAKIMYKFSWDLLGDGVPIWFYSLDSLRDGKEGCIWIAYRKSDGVYKTLGHATFSEMAFAPAVAKGGKSKGFCTFWPGGAGQGLLVFFKVTETSIDISEQDRVDNHQDRVAMESLFDKKGVEVKVDTIPLTP